MKTITTIVYTFDELSDKAKEKARDWYRQNFVIQEDAWEQIQEEGKEIGLKIFTLDDRRNNEGEFIGTAIETAQKIRKNHGKQCDTYKTTARYWKASYLKTEAARENSEHEFLHDLLEDYRVMFDKHLEYLASDEYVDENIRANEYTFTADGKREG